jgi:hypothetical protein
MYARMHTRQKGKDGSIVKKTKNEEAQHNIG